ncbi:hypothetical protein [Bifidobacterium thermophilum]|uniref:hypothetical protein n=1 Tax=Bifidobacterium thermophilum TaxID=33905 RepID=UPI0011775C12|nr:hypothetical protein [Bifidobacterium thermophilum]
MALLNAKAVDQSLFTVNKNATPCGMAFVVQCSCGELNTKPENATGATANETHEISLPLYLPLMQTGKRGDIAAGPPCQAFIRIVK